MDDISNGLLKEKYLLQESLKILEDELVELRAHRSSFSVSAQSNEERIQQL